jgi:hypothetical protein
MFTMYDPDTEKSELSCFLSLSDNFHEYSIN